MLNKSSGFKIRIKMPYFEYLSRWVFCPRVIFLDTICFIKLIFVTIHCLNVFQLVAIMVW